MANISLVFEMLESNIAEEISLGFVVRKHEVKSISITGNEKENSDELDEWWYKLQIQNQDYMLFLWPIEAKRSYNMTVNYQSVERLIGQEKIIHISNKDAIVPDTVPVDKIFYLEDKDYLSKIDNRVLSSLNSTNSGPRENESPNNPRSTISPEAFKSMGHNVPGSLPNNPPINAPGSFGNSPRSSKVPPASTTDQTATPTTTTEATKAQSWLLKINPDTWDIRNLKEGQRAIFGSYNGDVERPDYLQFQRVKVGDEIYAYAHGARQEIVAIFTVTKALNREDNGVENLNFTISKMLKPTVPLEYFASLISFADQLVEDNPNCLFYLSDIPDAIIGIGTARELVAPFSFPQEFTLEGSHKGTDDKLKFDNDYEAFATVICLKNVHPPLAIGLFGNWGSGKSFFMEKLSDRIDKIKGKDPRFVENVVAVKFNSWHYSDSNLWASLITDIFEALQAYGKDAKKEDEIKKIQDTLQITSVQKVAVEQKQREVQIEVDNLTTIQQNNREQLKDVSGFTLLSKWITDKGVKDDLKELNNDGIEKILSDTEKINHYIDTVNSFTEQCNLLFKQLKDFKGIRWWLFILLTGLVYIFVILIRANWHIEWEHLTSYISTWYGVIALAAAKIGTSIESTTKIVKSINKRLASVKATMATLPQDTPPDLKDANKRLLELKTEIQGLDTIIAEKQQFLDDIYSGKRLSEFIGQRAKEEQYTRQLGVISWIRKDFESLDELLREQHIATDERKEQISNPQKVTLKIDRIVLYVDDLDRCNENVVVKVLEAIHLLLAFELFVVVVGVDPTWLDNALNTKYDKLFHPQDKNEQPKRINGRQITSYDYLEKIFQVPFAIRSVNKSGRNALLQYLTRNEKVTQQVPPETGKKEEKAPTTASDTGSKSGASNSGTSPEAGSGQSSSDTSTRENKVPVADRVQFAKGELEYMEAISGLFGDTPRMINRFINIYRIIKSHKGYQVGTVISSRDYKPTLISLGMIVGCPEQAQDYINMIYKTESEELIIALEETENAALKEYFKKNVEGEYLDGIFIDSLKINLPLIARFSFRTHVVEENEQS